MSDQLELEVEIALPPPPDPNPCVQRYGPGPEGKKCKTCALLWVHQTANRYYKCKLRTFTRGPGSDHRVRWNACGRYEEGA